MKVMGKSSTLLGGEKWQAEEEKRQKILLVSEDFFSGKDSLGEGGTHDKSMKMNEQREVLENSPQNSSSPNNRAEEEDEV